MRNENGVTLVELLISIVITFFITAVLYATVVFSMNYFNLESSKTEMQQELNLIVTKLQRIHREGECYILEVTSTEVAVLNCENPSNSTVISSLYEYDAEYAKNGEPVDPLQEDVYLEKLKVSEIGNTDISVEISTVISRLKDFKTN